MDRRHEVVVACRDVGALLLGGARLASRRRAVLAKAGSMSAYFLTRSRIAAKSADASMPQAAFR